MPLCNLQNGVFSHTAYFKMEFQAVKSGLQNQIKLGKNTETGPSFYYLNSNLETVFTVQVDKQKDKYNLPQHSH